jgi:hypothetical protein
MKGHGGVALVGGEWSASRPFCFTPGERATGTNWIGGWVDPRAGLDDMGKRKFITLPELELRPLGRPVRSQSLYRLRYPGPWCSVNSLQFYFGRYRVRVSDGLLQVILIEIFRGFS